MKLSEAPMMRTLLCKNRNAEWSEIFEIMKLGMSANGLAVYVRVMFAMNGQQPVCNHYWREITDLDNKFEIFDTLEKDLN